MRIKKIFRHSYVSALFVIGLAISCFVLINVSNLVSNMLQDSQQLHKYKFEKYVSVLYMEPTSSELESTLILDALSCAEEVTEGNLFLVSLVQLNKSLDQYTVRVLVKENEETGLSYAPLNEKNKKNGAIIGESLKSQLLKDSEGYYVELSGIRIPIIGILDNKSMGGVDTSFYLFWENCDETLQHKDEPTGALDQHTGNEIMNCFEEINRTGKTVILITHDLAIANRCKRMIQIEDGVIV